MTLLASGLKSVVYLLLEKLDDAVAKLYVLASGIISVLRRVGVVHPYLWLDCGYTLIRQSMEVGRPENTLETELFTFRLCSRLSSKPVPFP